MWQDEHYTGNVYAEVSVALPLKKTLHYALPNHLRPLCSVGKRVLIPLGKRKVTGYIVNIGVLPPAARIKDIKEILDVLDKIPLFNRKMLGLYRWIASHYVASLGEVIKTALPTSINIESSYHVSLTTEGKKVVATPSCHQMQHGDILQTIDPYKGTSLKRFLDKHPNRSALLLLEKQGLISLEPKLRSARTKIKKEMFVRLTAPHATPDGGTAKERELLMLLKAQGCISLSHLKTTFKRPLSLLRQLQERGLVTLENQEVYRNTPMAVVEREEPRISLTSEQQTVLQKIVGALKDHAFKGFLLQGVTGSGKTEVYLRAVQQALALGKSALILVPEISLTPQLLGRFRKRLEVDMALLHSGLSAGDRYDQWRRVTRGEVKVVIGARSAIFAPCNDLGLIIVDEEHDSSYKQEDFVRYNARDLALLRARSEGAITVLGSATPSLESLHNCEKGKLELLHMTSRIHGKSLPQVDVVDLKRERQRLLSFALRDALVDNLRRGEQSLLFLNRRGYSNSIICTDCGSPFKCSRCSVTLTFHAQRKALLCHHCGYHLRASQICPHCGGSRLQSLGFGTERVEKEIRTLFPQATVARMDSDVMTKRDAYGRLLQALERREIDILIGTQMIVKGHDFPQITLMGIVAADVTINLPDFRATERGFQLISQAAGRVGRGDRPGPVIIQTFLPDHYVIQTARKHDYMGFYQQEMAYRRALGYPPFTRIINIRVSAKSAREAEETIRRLAKRGEIISHDYSGAVDILGPSPSPITRLHSRYRWQLLVKSDKISLLQQFVRALMDAQHTPRRVRVSIDVDPYSLL